MLFLRLPGFFSGIKRLSLKGHSLRLMHARSQGRDAACRCDQRCVSFPQLFTWCQHLCLGCLLLLIAMAIKFVLTCEALCISLLLLRLGSLS